MTRLVETEVNGLVRATEGNAWDVFVPIDFVKVFKGKGPLPAVVEVYNQSGPWGEIGQTRNLRLSDGSELTEEVTGVEPPGPRGARFGYTVHGYSGIVGTLISEGRGFWVFQERGAQTQITWRYSFLPKNVWTQPLVILIVLLFWRSYMKSALGEVIDLIEKGEAA